MYPPNTQIQRVDHDKSPIKKYALNVRRGTDETRLLNVEDSWRRWRKRRDDFEDIYAPLLRKANLGLTDRRNLHLICGGDPRGLDVFSDHATNPDARGLFVKEVLTQLGLIQNRADVSMYFVTIIDLDWGLPRSATQFDATSMSNRVKRAMRDTGYDGILFLEFQLVLNLKAFRYLPHVHGFFWRASGSEKPASAATLEKLLAPRFKGIDRAKPVDIVEIPHTLSPQNANKALAQRLLYATKFPSDAKSYTPAREDDNAFYPAGVSNMRKAWTRNYPNRDAVNILRLLSQFTIDQTVFAVGEGTKVRKAASKKLDDTASRKGSRFRNALPPRQLRSLFTKILGDEKPVV